MSLTRFDVKMDSQEKEVISHAAMLQGIPVAAFIRLATMEKARAVIDRESRVSMSTRDFQNFIAALESVPPFHANLHHALQAARGVFRA